MLFPSGSDITATGPKWIMNFRKFYWSVCLLILMFLCHINDLHDSVTSSVHLFADDCLLYCTIKQEDDHQALQKNLKNLEEWANKWGMRFNAKKCYTLSINKSSTRFYELNSHTLQEASDNPYLKWSIHINNVCKKANATLGFLRRNLRNVP